MSTISKNIFSKFVLIDIAETFTNIVPKGTHEWESFIEYSDLKTDLEKTNFEILDARGVSYNPLTEKMFFIPTLKLNYILSARKIS